MSVPIEAKSFTYTPALLLDREGAPKFTIRYGTRRDRHSHSEELTRRGYISHSEDDIKEAILSEIRRLSRNSDEEKNRMEDAARRFWAAVDAQEVVIKEWQQMCVQAVEEDAEAVLPPEPKMDFDPDEEAWVTGIINQVCRDSLIVGNMRADNSTRMRAMNDAAIAIVLVDVEGFELKRRTDGVIEKQSLIDLEEWLGDEAERLGLEESQCHQPFAELGIVAHTAFRLPKEAEKNFASPPPITSSPESSEKLPETEEDTTSKASANFQETPKDTSRKQTSTSSTSPSPVETDGDVSNGPTDGL